MDHESEVSIVIVNWKAAQVLRQCLASIYRSTCEARFEIVVVDNASFDGCGEMLRTEFPRVVFLQNKENHGFAAANNLAAQHSTGRYLLFLNPDTEVTPSAIEKMLTFLQRSPYAGAVGALLLNSDGTVQASCVQSYPSILNQVLDAEWLRKQFPLWR